jgi:anion-transporting  ArsA/GET3 family ATPase
LSHIILCCGVGGVGKTTISASLALRLALEGRRVAVITIDPARRLAESLGLSSLDDHPREIPLPRSHESAEAGALFALLLDVGTTFDRLVRRLARDEARAELILANRYYRYFSTRLAGAHEYMAMERLFELIEDDAFDVIVVDTPPSRHALDFLEAPERVANVMDRRVLHALSLPQTRRGLKLLQQGGEVVMGALDRLMGGRVIRDIAEFVAAFDGMTDVFAQRAAEGRTFLLSDRAAFLLVTTPSGQSVDETLRFREEIVRRGYPFRGLLVNRVFRFPEATFPASPAWEGLAKLDALAREDAAALARLTESLGGFASIWVVPEREGEVLEIGRLMGLLPHLPSFGELFTVTEPNQDAPIS